MATLTGFFSPDGSPALKVLISGVFPDSAKEFEGIIDTGSTGFLSMPLVQAFPIGLVLLGTTRLTFADGSSAVRLTAIAKVSVGDELHAGVVVLHPESEHLLLGMEFLKVFKKKLVVSQTEGTVLLVDEMPAPPAAASAPSS